MRATDIPIVSTGPVDATGPITLVDTDMDPVKPGIQSQKRDPSLPAKTTFQEDLTHAGQRQINLIWERTQAVIALMVVAFTMVCGAISMWKGVDIPNVVAVAFGMVTGFYFSRTNHAAIGGVGRKQNEHQPYEGR